MSRQHNQPTGTQTKSGTINGWQPILPNQDLRLIERLNWLGRIANLILNLEVRRGASNDFLVADANAVLQIEHPDQATENTTTAPPQDPGAGGEGGTGGLNWRGTWSSGTTDYAEDDVVKWTSNNQIGLFVAAASITGNGGDPFTGGTGDWIQIARDFSDRIYLRVGASEHLDIDANANKIVITNGSQIITIDAASELLKVTDGTTEFIFEGGTAQNFKITFDDGGTVQANKTQVAGRAIQPREFDVCDAGTPKKALFLASAVYT